MVSIIDNVITVTQGDTIDVPISIYLDEDHTEPYVPSSLDRIFFAVKSEDKPDTEPIFSVEIPTNTLQLRVEHEDTDKLKYKKRPYYYDVELIRPDNTHKTFISNLLYSTREVHK